MKRLIGIAAPLALFLFQTVGLASALEVKAPASVVLGGVATVYLPAGPHIQGVTVRLADAAGKSVETVRGFPYSQGSHSKGWVALLGIPTTISRGTYDIDVSAKTPTGDVREFSSITVDSRKFAFEDIRLDARLTRLQTENTALKYEQAVQLRHLLMTFVEHGVYQTGPLIVPVAHYRISAPFAERRHYVLSGGGYEPGIHEGIDLAVPEGTPIRAAGAGKVVYVADRIMDGNSVVIEQLPGVYSLYFHMVRAAVTVGQIVSQGQVIGYVGSTGIATGPHLHWQIDVNGIAVDPMSLRKDGLINPSMLTSLPSAQ